MKVNPYILGAAALTTAAAGFAVSYYARSSGNKVQVNSVEPPADAIKFSDSNQETLYSFLYGNAWYDEEFWLDLWKKEGVDPALWLEGAAILPAKKVKLAFVDSPALLIGSRRRWLVVCRYAGLEDEVSKNLWDAV